MLDQALRYNEGKAPLSMVFDGKDALIGCARVLAFGAVKYDRGNWLKGMPYTEITDSMLRHIAKFLCGEDIDQESGLPHVDHILCNALFLSQIVKTYKNYDDRTQEHKLEERTSNLRHADSTGQLGVESSVAQGDWIVDSQGTTYPYRPHR